MTLREGQEKVNHRPVATILNLQPNLQTFFNYVSIYTGGDRMESELTIKEIKKAMPKKGNFFFSVCIVIKRLTIVSSTPSANQTAN